MQALAAVPFMPSLNSFGSVGVEKTKPNQTTFLTLLTLNIGQSHQAWHRRVKLNGCCHCAKFGKAYRDSSLRTKKICWCCCVFFFGGGGGVGGGAQMAVWPANTDHYIPSHNFSRRVKNRNFIHQYWSTKHHTIYTPNNLSNCKRRF